MSKIFKNMIPYWKSIIIILALLFLQAGCDLSLPSYTSDIIDVGIQNSGVEHVIPVKMTSDDYEAARIFMTEEEQENWERIYEQDGDCYDQTDLTEDEELLLPLLMNYQVTQMKEQGTMDEADPQQMEQMKAMMANGMDEQTLLALRQKVEDTVDTMGSSLVKSMGIAYAVSCDKRAGVDIHQIQQNYLIKAGLKMVGMALLMGVATVLVGFFASRVAAGIGMNLREREFRQVVSFSNAEMDYQEYERYPADPDGICVTASYDCICADPWNWWCPEGDADRGRNGMDYYSGDSGYSRLCDGADVCSYAEVQADAEAGR